MYRWMWLNKAMQQKQTCIFITKACDAVFEKHSLKEIIYNIV